LTFLAAQNAAAPKFGRTNLSSDRNERRMAKANYLGCGIFDRREQQCCS
jgi:hypothetical protein